MSGFLMTGRGDILGTTNDECNFYVLCVFRKSVILEKQEVRCLEGF